MDFDADLTQIQGALLTADNTYDFKKFNYWEGNYFILIFILYISKQ